MGAVKQVTPSVSLSTDLLAQISLISAKYAAFNPDASDPLDPGTGFFLDTFWNQSGFTSTQKGTDELRVLLDSFDSYDNAVQFVENVLETAKLLPQIKDDPEAVRQFMGLASAYSKTNPKLASFNGSQLEEDPEFFLYTLLTSNNLAKAVDEFESFLRLANAITNYTDGIIFRTSEDGGFIAYDLIGNESEGVVSDGERLNYTPDDREDNLYASVRVLRAGERRDKPPEEREVYTGDQYFRFYSSREVQENLQNNDNTRLQPGEVAIYPGDIIQVEQGTTTALEPLDGAAILERSRRIVEAFSLVDRAAIGKGVELWDAINENKWLTGALLGTFAGLQFTPVGPILDAALVLVGGFVAGC